MRRRLSFRIYFINMSRSPLSSIKLLHSTTCFYFAECSLQGTKVKTSHGGLKFNLRVVGDNSVCHYDDPDKIQITFQNSFAFTVRGWAGQRRLSHPDSPTMCWCISQLARSMQKLTRYCCLSAQGEIMKQVQKLICPLTAPSAVSVVQAGTIPTVRTIALTECTAAKRCREEAYFFIRCLGTEQRLELN